MSDNKTKDSAPKLGVVAGSVSVGLVGLNLSHLPGMIGGINIEAKRYEPKPYSLGPKGATMRCRQCHGYWPDRCKCPKPDSQNNSGQTRPEKSGISQSETQSNEV